MRGEIVTDQNGGWHWEWDEQELRLIIDGSLAAVLTRWSDNKTDRTAWWRVVVTNDGGTTSDDACPSLREACALATCHHGIDLAPPAELLAEHGEMLSAPPAPAPAPAPMPNDNVSLERRLAELLDEIWGATLLIVRDCVDDRDVELRLGSFRKDLSERAAELLDEAGL